MLCVLKSGLQPQQRAGPDTWEEELPYFTTVSQIETTQIHFAKEDC